MSEPTNVIEPHVAARARCCCGHEWIAVRPLKVEHVNVECPACGMMTGLDVGPHWPAATPEQERCEMTSKTTDRIKARIDSGRIDEDDTRWLLDKLREAEAELEWARHQVRVLYGRQEKLNAAIARAEAAEARAFAMAAGQCCVEGGLVGDDHGHPVCTLEAVVKQLRARVAKQACEAKYPWCAHLSDCGECFPCIERKRPAGRGEP